MKHFAGWIDERSDLGGDVGRRPDAEARRSVADTFEKRGVVVQRRLDDGEARSRALLAGVAERRPHEIDDGAVDVGARGDDDAVLAARLGEQSEIGPPPEEHLRSGVRAGQDDGGDVGVGDEPAPGFVVVGRDELEDIAVDAGGPAQLGDERGGCTTLRRGLEDHGVPSRERGEDTAGRDGEREVPGRRDDDRTER